MATKAALSHTFAALFVLVLSPVLKGFVTTFVSTRDILEAIAFVGQQIANYPSNPFGLESITTALYLVTFISITMTWGYLYHLSRH